MTEKKNKSDDILDNAFKEANKIVGDILGGGNQSFDVSAFGKLINKQTSQMNHVTKTYEDELVTLTKKNKELESVVKDLGIKAADSQIDKEQLKKLEDDKKKLESCLDKYAKTIENLQKKIKENEAKKSKQKTSK